MNSTPPATPPTVFCSYAFTGEDEAVVRARMRTVVAALEQVGCAVYCNLFDPAWSSYHTPGEFIRRALSVLPQYDMVLVVQASPRRSEGMLMEVGAGQANRPGAAPQCGPAELPERRAHRHPGGGVAQRGRAASGGAAAGE